MELSQYLSPGINNTYHLFDHVDNAQLKPLIKASRRANMDLNLNFSQVRSLNMTGLKGLVKLLQTYRRLNLSISLVDVTASVQTYLELTQVDKLFASVLSQPSQLPQSA